MILEEKKGAELCITRIFDVPKDKVFQAWTDASYLKHWWAPKTCTLTYLKIDFKVGGTIHSCIKTPNGKECWMKGVYQEIIVPEKIVYTSTIVDKNGNSVSPVDVGMDKDWPRETLITVHFDDMKSKTKITLSQTVLESLAKRTGAYPSWVEMFDRLFDILIKF
ncbi:MAG: SRPBCC domain-containing protein [Alphaproteobacteria bacterium]|nr:SRPBCC domain-containing protein [Alphaproteobacteria bacterium]